MLDKPLDITIMEFGSCWVPKITAPGDKRLYTGERYYSRLDAWEQACNVADGLVQVYAVERYTGRSE